MGRIDDIMCNDITCEDLHLASVAGLDDITCDDLNMTISLQSVCDYGPH